MFRPLTIAAISLLVVLAAGAADANAEGAVKRAAEATARGIEKGGEAVVHVVKKGAAGVTYGVDKAGAAVTHVAKEVGLPTDKESPPKNTDKTK